MAIIEYEEGGGGGGRLDSFCETDESFTRRRVVWLIDWDWYMFMLLGEKFFEATFHVRLLSES